MRAEVFPVVVNSGESVSRVSGPCLLLRLLGRAVSRVRALAWLRPTVSRLEVPSSLDMVRVLRDRAAEYAAGMSFTKDEVEDIRLAVGEAAVNACRHGSSTDWQKIGMDLARKNGGLKVAIWDKGPGFDPGSVCTDSECLVDGGRGIFLIRSLMDDVQFRFTNPGTRIEMTKLLKPREHPNG